MAIMAGVQSATLEGWAIPAFRARRYDHTYVVTSCGLSWGCRGRAAGGAIIASGAGSSIVADCLAQPNGLAAINYAITGVCHQIANRILHPGQFTVAVCNGYPTSAFLYGPYGLGAWPEKSRCYQFGTVVASNVGGNQRLQGDGMTNKEAYDRSVATRNSVPPGEDAARLADLAALTKLGLGYTLESKTLDALAAIQADLRAKQQRLRERLEENLINPQEYLDGVNAALKTSMERSIMLLGNERFAAIFGEAGRCPEELIDSEAFLADNTSAH